MQKLRGSRLLGETRSLSFALMEERSQQLAERASGCGGSVVRNIRRDLAEDKFLQDVDGSACANSDERVFKCQCRAIAITGWVVEIGNATRGKASQNL